MQLTDEMIWKQIQKLPHPHAPQEIKLELATLPSLGRLADMRERYKIGGPLAGVERKVCAIEELTWKLYRVEFYFVVYFLNCRYFETEAEALDFAGEIKTKRKNVALIPREVAVYAPKSEMFQIREKVFLWRCPGFRPDPLYSSPLTRGSL